MLEHVYDCVGSMRVWKRERGPLVLSDRGIRSKGGIYLSLTDSPVSGLLLRLLRRLLCYRTTSEGKEQKVGGLNL